MKIPITLCLLGALLCGQTWGAINRVTKPEARENLLAQAGEVLQASPRAFTEMPHGRNNPFAAMSFARTAEANEDVENEAPPETQSASRLSDANALAAVSRNFHASGSIVAGDRKILRLQNDRMVREGATFTARIQDEAYEVTVSEITRDGYALKIGNATIRRSFLDAPSQGRPAPPAEPEPTTGQ